MGWTDAFQAIGTVGAVVVALGVAGLDNYRNNKFQREQKQTAKIRTAGLVSAWVETEYIPSKTGTRYDKISHLHVSNEGDEPVFNVAVDVAIGHPPKQIGPVSAPVPIPTLSARRERIFDITSGLLAHELAEGRIYFNEPVAKMNFTDRLGKRWHRDYNGILSEIDPKIKQHRSEIEGNVADQVGTDSLLNPLRVAIAFLEAARGQNEDDIQIARFCLDDQAAGWGNISDQEIKDIFANVANKSIATHVWYRTPRVAYVRIMNETSIPSEVPIHDGTQIEADVLTLVFRGNRGWRIFSIGGTTPEWIQFSKNETNSPLRGYLDSEAPTE